MNWTEGSLARHSRRKGWNEEAARQKQYFAKQRARVQIKPSQPNPKLGVASFVPSYIPQSTRGGHGALGSTPARQRGTSRKRLIHLSSEAGSDGTGSSLSRHSSLRLGDNTREPVAVDELPNLEAKRRRLLDKNDWTGIGLQRPLSTGSSVQHQGTHHDSAHRKPRDKHHIVGAVSQDRRHHAHSSHRTAVLRPDKRISIRLGARDYRWSQGSNTIKSQGRALSSLPTLQDWTFQRDTPGSPNSLSYSASSALTSSNTALSTLQPHAVEQNASRRGQWPLLAPLVAAQNGEQECSRKEPTQRRGISNEAQIVVCSSPRRIHHPRPSRTRQPQLLGMRSPSLGPAESIVVQVGKSKTPIRNPRDDAKWMDWLASSGVRDDRQTGTQQATYPGSPSRTITPGISNHWEQSESASPIGIEALLHEDPPGIAKDAAQCEATDTTPLEPELPRLLQPLSEYALTDDADDHFSAKPDTSSRDSLNQVTVRVNELPPIPALHNASNGLDLMGLLEGEEPGLRGDDDRGLETNLEGDEDEIWKKFVLDDDADEITRRAREEAHAQTKRQVWKSPPETLRSDVAEPPATPPRRKSPVPFVSRRDHMQQSDSPPLGNSTSRCPPHSPPRPPAKPDTSSSSTIAQLGSPPAARAQHAEHRFHQPRLFVGRLASLHDAETAAPAVPMRIQAKWGKGRRANGGARRRREAGRLDIRALPNFEDDPIEESL